MNGKVIMETWIKCAWLIIALVNLVIIVYG